MKLSNLKPIPGSLKSGKESGGVLAPAMEQLQDMAIRDSVQRAAAQKQKVLKADRCRLRGGSPREDSKTLLEKNIASLLSATSSFLKGKRR